MDSDVNVGITATNKVDGAARAAAGAIRDLAGSVRSSASQIKGGASTIVGAMSGAASVVGTQSDKADSAVSRMAAGMRQSLRLAALAAREFGAGFRDGMREAVAESDRAARETAKNNAQMKARQGRAPSAVVAGGVGGFVAGMVQQGVPALRDFATQTLNVADDLGDLAARLGTSTTAVQTLSGVFVASGGTPDLMTDALDKLNQGLGAFTLTGKGPAAGAFKALGIDGQIASGKIKGTEQTFYAIVKAMEGIKDPAEKSRLSMQLFGRAAGTDMLEVLGVGEKAMQGYRQEMISLGLVMDEELLAKTAEAKLEIDKAAFGLKTFATIGAAQAIQSIKQFGESLAPLMSRLDGVRKALGPDMAAATKTLSPIFKDIAAQFVPLLEACVDLGEAFAKAFGPAIILVAKGAANLLRSVIGVIMDLLKGAAALLRGDFVGAWGFAASAVGKAVGGIKQAWADGWAFIGASLGKIVELVVQGFAQAGAKMVQAGRDMISGLIRGMQGGKGAAQGAARDVASGTSSAFASQLQIKSPSKVFEGFGRNTIEGYVRGLQLSKPMIRSALRDAFSGVMEGLMTEQERQALDLGRQAAVLNAALKSGVIGSTEYNEAIRRLIQTGLKPYREELQALRQELSTEGEQAQARYREQVKLLDRELQAGRIGLEEYIALLMKASNIRLNKVIDAKPLPKTNEPGLGNVPDAVKLDQIGNKATGLASKLKTAFDPLREGLAGAFKAMITGASSFADIVSGVADQVLSSLTRMAADALISWISAQLGMTTATTAGATARTAVETGAAATSVGLTAGTALSQIGANAASAFAGAYAAIAGIPVVGPFLAPAVAAAAFAGVMAVGSKVFSARGGMANVPEDGMPFELHREEMVLPAWMARPFRDTLQAARGVRTGQVGIATATVGARAIEGAQNRDADMIAAILDAGDKPKGGAGASINISAVDARSIKRLLERNAPATKRGLARLARDNE